MKLILASQNPAKFDEFNMHLNEVGIELMLPNFSVEIEENEDSLLENAKLKALAYSRKLPNEYFFATDGGVKIPFLGDNWNFLLTKRLSGKDMFETHTDQDRAKILLDMMKEAKGKDREISWHESFAIARNNVVLYEFEGHGNTGILADTVPDNLPERGYWIGHLWIVPSIGKTYMDLTAAEKKQTSSVGTNLKIDIKKSFSKLFLLN